MGIEWLEIVVRVEKQFPIRIDTKAFLEWEGSRPVRHRAAEMTCLQLCECLNDPNYLLCAACGYPLKGLASQGSCPECGLPYGTVRVDWRSFQQVLMAATRMSETKVSSDARVVDVIDAV